MALVVQLRLVLEKKLKVKGKMLLLFKTLVTLLPLLKLPCPMLKLP